MLAEQLRKANNIRKRIRDLQSLICVHACPPTETRFNKDCSDYEPIRNAVLAKIKLLEEEFNAI